MIIAMGVILITFVANLPHSLADEPPVQTYYVDAARPDDTGDSLTPATAKRTIDAALTLAKISTRMKATQGSRIRRLTGD